MGNACLLEWQSLRLEHVRQPQSVFHQQWNSLLDLHFQVRRIRRNLLPDAHHLRQWNDQRHRLESQDRQLWFAGTRNSLRPRCHQRFETSLLERKQCQPRQPGELRQVHRSHGHQRQSLFWIRIASERLRIAQRRDPGSHSRHFSGKPVV